MLFIFSTPELIRNLWQLKTTVFLHWCLLFAIYIGEMLMLAKANGTAYIRHQCRKATVLSCHRCLVNTGVEKNELNLNID
jgi:hypothetical protein